MKKAALLSVSDRSGLLEFARALKTLDYVLLGSSGTRKALLDAGIECESIEESSRVNFWNQETAFRFRIVVRPCGKFLADF